jgi:hypothetical protein
MKTSDSITNFCTTHACGIIGRDALDRSASRAVPAHTIPFITSKTIPIYITCSGAISNIEEESTGLLQTALGPSRIVTNLIW